MRQPERRTLLAYWIGAALVLAIAIYGAIKLATIDYRERFENERHSTLLLARTIAEHTTQVFSSIDAVSRVVAEDWERSGSLPELSELLKQRSDAEPAAIAISITDVSGRIIATSAGDMPVGVRVLDAEGRLIGTSKSGKLLGLDLSGSKGFQQIRNMKGPNKVVGLPLLVPTSERIQGGGWVVNYMRRIEGARGNFAGAVLITVDNPYLYNFYARLDPSHQSIISLVGKDGVIRAWSGPGPSLIGQNLGAIIQADFEKADGTAIRTSMSDGAERLWGFSEVPGYPLLVYIGIPTEPIYRSFALAALMIGALLSLLVLTLGALGVLLTRYMRGREEVTSSLIEATTERRERMFFEAIFNTGGMLGLVVDRSGQAILANPAFLAIFKIPKDESGGGDWLRHILGRDLSEVLPILPYSAHMSIVDRKGRRREISFTVTGIGDEKGLLRNILVIGFDITNRRAAELAIYQSSKLITLGEMATGLTHELNQPLSTIGLAIENLKARVDSEGIDRAYLSQTLSRVDQHVQRAAAIVNHMRIFGRRSEGHSTSFNPVDAIEGALTIAEAYLASTEIRIRRHYSERDCIVSADRTLVEQILLNLMANARDAIHELRANRSDSNYGGIIDISVSRNNGDVRISIADNGCGIPAAISDRIFEPFFTTKAVGKGTGLGLALSYGIATDLGGDLQARNKERGAEFILSLPAMNREEGSLPSHQIAAVI